MTSLTEPTFLILLSLSQGERHGYAIMQDVSVLSDQRVQLSTGTLYTALKRMLEDGWIEQVETEDASRGKRTYRLTAFGEGVTRQETERLTKLISIAQLRLGDV